MTNVPLIPREEIFGNPVKSSPELSPDGKMLAYTAPDEGVMNVWLRTIGKEDDRPITHDRKRGVTMFGWAYDGKHILYMQDSGGDENYHVYAVDYTNDTVRDLTPFEGIRAEITTSSHRFPNEILIALNNRDVHVHDIHRLNVITGEITMEAENTDNVARWLADTEFAVRGAWRQTEDGGFELRVRDTRDSDWRTTLTCGPDENTYPIAWAEDGKSIYMMDSRGTNTCELRLLNTITDESMTLAANPEVDLDNVFFREIDRRVQAVGFDKNKLEWTVLDPDIAEDFDTLKRFKPGRFGVVSRDLSDRTWIVFYDDDVSTPAYYVYDRATQKLDFLFSTRPALDKYRLAEMRPIEIKSRDGLTLHCYLTLPPDTEPKNLPMVLNVHGGPWGRDSWGYRSEPQWLANRGYACLQVNFRGSIGFGIAFMNAGDREWGGKMHDDLIDAVQWAIQEGIADSKRIAIYGGSYGGYAALCGAAFTPEVFACAVDLVGISNLRTFLASIPPYWETMRKMMDVRVGNVEKDGEFLDARSPLNSAHRIICPMLIAQGANDPRVKQAESEQIVASLRERGKPVEYLLFEDEGHGFVRPENRLKYYEASERFLAEHIGGRFLP